MHTVTETPDYLRDARAAGLSENERSANVDDVASHPEAGDLIPGTGGARKIRLAGRGKGKSAKGDKINLTVAERNEFKTILTEGAAAYRKGLRRHEQGR